MLKVNGLYCITEQLKFYTLFRYSAMSAIKLTKKILKKLQNYLVLEFTLRLASLSINILLKNRMLF